MIPWQDTLIAHHSFASHAPQRLEQPVSTYLDASPWKVIFGRRGSLENQVHPEDMSGEMLTAYNGADCRVTIKAWDGMQADLARERHVYEHDMCLAELCADMHRDGIGVDLGRKQQLDTMLEAMAKDYKERLREIAKDATFNPGSYKQVAKVLFTQLGAKPFGFTDKGRPSSGKVTIEALRLEDGPIGEFARLLGKRREAVKIRSTYLNLSSDTRDRNKRDDLIWDSRAHFSWGPREKRDERTSGGGHTVSGRLASRFQSVPRYNPENTADRVREIYVPRSKDHCFVYFDVAQGEPKVGAYLSGDPVRIEIANTGDVHAGNAKIMFPDVAAKGWLDGDAKKDPARGKPIRDLAKTTGLAVDYFAEAPRTHAYMAQNRFHPVTGKALFGLPTEGQVAAIIARIRLAYKVYVKFVQGNLEKVRKEGFLRDPILGRIRWLGWYPAITDVANYPIQACLAAVMNLRTLQLRGGDRFEAWKVKNPEICERVSLPRKRMRLPRSGVLACQVHDSCSYDVLESEAARIEDYLAELWGAPVHLPGGALTLTIDRKRGERLSEL